MKRRMKIFSFMMVVLLMSWKLAQADPTTDAVKVHPSEVPSTHLTQRQIVEALQLTEAQKKQIRVTRAAYRVNTAKLDSRIKVTKVELENELDKPEPDNAKIDLLTSQIGVLYGKRLNVSVKASLELERKILTPQQSDDLKALQLKQGSASGEIL